MIGLFRGSDSERDVTPDEHARADYTPLKSWARSRLDFDVIESRRIEIVCTGDGIEKRIRFSETGEISVSWTWDPTGREANAMFASEISLFRPLEIIGSPDGVRWTSPVETVSKSEKGWIERFRESLSLFCGVRLSGGITGYSPVTIALGSRNGSASRKRRAHADS
jgi:hypothetical protein